MLKPLAGGIGTDALGAPDQDLDVLLDLERVG